jgi:hypothetical protein
MYLKRVWCIYELYTASVSDSCTLTIEMPQSTKDNLKEFLITSKDPNAVKNKINQVLGNTSIEDAEASVQSDKENILKLVREGDGGCTALDIKVNELIRNWNKESLYGFLEDAKVDISGKYKRIYWF